MPKIIMKNLVLLWGWNRYENSYKELVDLAPKDWKVHHFSYSKLMPSANIEELHQNILSYIKKNKLKKIYLMGHSLGGSLALDFTARYPQSVKKLFLSDSEGVYDNKPILSAFLHTVKAGTTSKNEIKKNLHGLVRTFKNPILHAKLGWHAHHIDLQKEASSLKVPTLILWGVKDKVTPLW